MTNTPFHDPTTRTYRARRDQWGRVQCNVRDSGPPRALESIGFHSLAGFEMGADVPGAKDLALSILCDHLAVSVDVALSAYRNNFHTADVRLLYVWMNHMRLVEQVIVKEKDALEVTEWALDRLLRRGFIHGELEQTFKEWVTERERVKLGADGHYVREYRAGVDVKPCNEVKS